MSRRRRPPPRAVYGGRLINSRGGTRKWSQIVAAFVAAPGNTVCWLRFPKCTVRSQTIDHYWPMKTHPHLTDEPSNWRPACRYCNRARRHTLPGDIPKLRIQLEAEFATNHKRPKALGFFE